MEVPNLSHDDTAREETDKQNRAKFINVEYRDQNNRHRPLAPSSFSGTIFEYCTECIALTIEERSSTGPRQTFDYGHKLTI